MWLNQDKKKDREELIHDGKVCIVTKDIIEGSTIKSIKSTLNENENVNVQ